eukprot:4786381-Pyramimonas_sp.AAC.1
MSRFGSPRGVWHNLQRNMVQPTANITACRYTKGSAMPRGICGANKRYVAIWVNSRFGSPQ